MRRAAFRSGLRQRGAAVMVIMLILGLLAAYFGISALNRGSQNERNRINVAALAQAKEALIGFAATYRDTHVGQVFGYLPCADTDNNGSADTCGAKDVNLLFRLPWRTLGLDAMRDMSGECLWYGVSGSAKDSQASTTATLNWDTLGQFVVKDADGNTLAGASAHEQPLAVVLAPGATRMGQNRGPSSATVCGGNNTRAAYLDGSDPLYAGTAPAASAITTLVLESATSQRNGTNNDQGRWVTSRDVFDRVKMRSDFKSDIDNMLGDLANCVNFNSMMLAPPIVSVGSKGIDTLIAACPASDVQKTHVLANWKDNLLYTHPVSAGRVNGNVGCDAVLLFGGERTTRTVPPLTEQTRSTVAEKGNAATFGDSTMYLEGSNATLFPASGNYIGLTAFNSANASTEIVRCLKNPPVGGARTSFAYDFATFAPTGALTGNSFGIRTYNNGITANDNTNLLYFDAAPGMPGACFWRPTVIPLAGKIVRAYYNFTFEYPDTFALTGTGSDRGNGFSFQIVRGDLGAPVNCGSGANMGVLDAGDSRGMQSIFVETDVHRDAGYADSVENHTAIMTNGNLIHSAANGSLTLTCDGSAAGCRHTPANLFEEALLPKHNQRIEIHTGCNAGCSSCTPSAHGVPNNYAWVSVWVDCVDCDDTVVDLNRVEKPPTINQCLLLDPALNQVYFGFTGGFRSGAAQQGVKIENLFLRSE